MALWSTHTTEWFVKLTVLPGWLVAPYTSAVPYCELAIGVCLAVGIATRQTLIFSALLLISLDAGMMLQLKHEVVSDEHRLSPGDPPGVALGEVQPVEPRRLPARQESNLLIQVALGSHRAMQEECHREFRAAILSCRAAGATSGARRSCSRSSSGSQMRRDRVSEPKKQTLAAEEHVGDALHHS